MGERGVTFRTCVADDGQGFVVHFDHAPAGEEPEHAAANDGKGVGHLGVGEAGHLPPRRAATTRAKERSSRSARVSPAAGV